MKNHKKVVPFGSALVIKPAQSVAVSKLATVSVNEDPPDKPQAL